MTSQKAYMRFTLELRHGGTLIIEQDVVRLNGIRTDTRAFDMPATLSHEHYMSSVLERRGVISYPGFSNDPLYGFSHVSADLAKYGHDSSPAMIKRSSLTLSVSRSSSGLRQNSQNERDTYRA